jgi:hypothetical protein
MTKLGLRTTLLAVLACVPTYARAADEVSDYIKENTRPVGFLIIGSTKSYEKALEFLRKAAAQSGVPIDLREVVFDPNFGLTFSKQAMEAAGDPLYTYPWYLHRGRGDDGVYLSIERSDSYDSFAPGFFVVMAASGAPQSAELTETLEKVKRWYPDAYVKSASVYFGCMH